MGLTEQQIVDGCRRADPEARSELYARTCDSIYRLLLRMTRHEADAADVMQETYLRAFDRIGQFDGGASVGTWVYRIAVNEALQFLRRGKRQAKLVVHRREQTREAVEPSDQDAVMDMSEAIGRLPEFEQALIVLRYYEGLSYAEIADLLDRPAGTIGSGLNRARAMLRESLSDQDEENG